MPVGVALVGRTGGHLHGVKSHGRSHQVQAAVQGLGNDAQAARHDTGPELDARQKGGPQDGGKGRM